MMNREIVQKFGQNCFSPQVLLESECNFYLDIYGKMTST